MFNTPTDQSHAGSEKQSAPLRQDVFNTPTDQPHAGSGLKNNPLQCDKRMCSTLLQTSLMLDLKNNPLHCDKKMCSTLLQTSLMLDLKNNPLQCDRRMRSILCVVDMFSILLIYLPLIFIFIQYYPTANGWKHLSTTESLHCQCIL